MRKLKDYFMNLRLKKYRDTIRDNSQKYAYIRVEGDYFDLVVDHKRVDTCKLDKLSDLEKERDNYRDNYIRIVSQENNIPTIM